MKLFPLCLFYIPFCFVKGGGGQGVWCMGQNLASIFCSTAHTHAKARQLYFSQFKSKFCRSVNLSKWTNGNCNCVTLGKYVLCV